MSVRQDKAIDTHLSEKLRFFSFCAAMGVVCLHVKPHFEIMSISWFVQMLFVFVGEMAIPYFFIVSGFFLGRSMCGGGWWRDAVVRRVRSLWMPLIIWNCIAMIFYGCIGLCSKCFSASGDFAQSGLSRCSLAGLIGLNFFDYPIFPFYWYVRMLFLFVLVSPALLLCERKRSGVCFVVTMFVTHVFLAYTNMPEKWRWFFCWTFSFKWLACFGAGIWLYNNRIRVKGVVAAIIMGCGVILYAFTMFFNGHETLAFLGGISCLAGVWSLSRGIPISAIIASCSFPIFTIHWFVVSILIMVLGTLCLSLNSLSVYILSLMVTVGVSLGLAYALRRWCGWTARIAFGR